jgi:hypothetical protein
VLEFSDVAVAHAVQLAVAPVFLLTGIAAILAVMSITDLDDCFL